MPITASFTTALSGMGLTVNGTGSSDTGGAITAYAWDFGDGTSTTGATPVEKVYADPNSYLVTLTVTGPSGTASTTRAVAFTATVPESDPLNGVPRSAALISAPSGQRIVLTCGAGQWEEVLSRDADGVETTDLRHMDPAKYGIFATSEDRRYVVSAYVRARTVGATDTDATVSIGAAFFLPTSYRSTGGALYENLGFSDGFSNGFSGYSYLRLAGLNASDMTCDLLVTGTGAFPATTSLATTVKVGVFGCTDPTQNGIYKGGGTGQPLVYADVQPRPGDLLLATKTFVTPQWSTAAGSWTSPTATNTKYEVGESFYDYGSTLTPLSASEVTDRIQMSSATALTSGWKRIEKEVVVPPGARVLVPVVDIAPNSALDTGTRQVEMTAVMVNRSQNYVTEIYS